MQDWWRGAVIYQVYPRSFMDGNGDGIGDLPGIVSKLDHVASLGVDAVWLSPIFTSPMRDMGYDVANHTDIDPLFGTLADFDRLLACAHDRGLRVLIDQVVSHSSDQHPLFRESRSSRVNPKADWYVWANAKPDGTPPNNWLSRFGGPAWEWDARRRQYYLHNFLREQPDLNFHNPDVQEFVLGAMKFWLDRGVDGFRLDTVNFYFHDQMLRDNAPDFRPGSQEGSVPYEMQYHLFSKNRPENLTFLQRIRALVDQYDDRVLVGEVGDTHHPNRLMGDYTSDGRLHMAYSFEMLGRPFSPRLFRDQIEGFYAGAPRGWPCWAFSNHDVPRHVTRWADRASSWKSFAKLCAAMLLSFEGTVSLYQGEELGQSETELSFEEILDPQGRAFWPDDKGRDGCRTPMAWSSQELHAGFSVAETTWLPVKPPQRARALDTQEEPDSVLATYRKLIQMRRQHNDMRLGRTTFVQVDDGVLAFRRGDSMFFAFNLSTGEQQVQLPFAASAALTQECEVKDGHLELGPNGFFIGTVASGKSP